MKLFKISFLFLCSFLYSLAYSDVQSHFNKIKRDPNALYAFFKAMPKGGELHYHLAGGAYPESMLAAAAKDGYCIDKNTFTATPSSSTCEGLLAQDFLNQQGLYDQLIKSWSMKDFIPGKESGHDHFFNSFEKYLPIITKHRPFLLADIIQRAAQQQEHYLEVMDLPDQGASISFGKLIEKTPSFAEKRQILLANKEFQQNIAHTANESEELIKQTRQYLGCQDKHNSPACKVKVKFLYYVLREQPLDQVFAQTLNAFEAVSHSHGALIGVNIVQAEDGLIALRDYDKQMQIFNYLHQVYPQVPISLHAGELAPESVLPKELGFHIHDALFIGHAQRIGHGVDIAYENQAESILKHMAEHSIPVEINLVSNQKILNVSGPKHPLNYYLSHQVPVVLSSDDEGVLRTDLTHQYVEAAIQHHVDYPALKQMNRNTLTYAFLPGKSIWADAAKGILIKDCSDLNSELCRNFIKDSEKAKLQWELEQELSHFEGLF